MTLELVTAWLTSAFVRMTIEGVLLAAPVWLLCRFVPGLPASLRAWLWWGVSLKLLLAALAAPALSIEAFPASWAATFPSLHSGAEAVPPAGIASSTSPTRPVTGARTPLPPVLDSRKPLARRVASAPVDEPDAARSPRAGRVLALVWLSGLTAHLLLLALHGARLRRIVRRGLEPASELVAEYAAIASRLGLTRVPRLLESSEVSVPQVAGIFHPTVLVPQGTAKRLSARERAMVLCHELTHVRRRDLTLAWIPALAERVLVWHPLAWLATREYLLAREGACDRAVLRVLDTEAHDYGQLLVRLGISAPVAGVAAAGASPSFRQLRRRLFMLQHSSSRSSRAAWLGSIAAALVVSMIPLRLVAERGVTVISTGTNWNETDAATEPPTTVEAVVPAARAAQDEKPARGETRGEHRRGSWVYLHAGDDSMSMNGDWDDVETAKRLRGSKDQALFYFRRDGKAYTIEDPATLETIRTIFGPQEELGKQQGFLGEKQGKLGAEQGKLGERQGELGARQGEIGAKQGVLGAQLAAAHADVLTVEAERLRGRATEEDVRRREREVRARAEDLERQIRELGDRQAALGEQQAALGHEQGKLGAVQSQLGQEQARLGELQRQAAERADAELRELVDRAIAQGLAREVR